MKQLEMIVGVSFFSGGPLVGIALKGDQDSIGCTTWAGTFKCGHPQSVEPRNGRDVTDEQEIKYLADKWQAWADLNKIEVKINRKGRRVEKPF